MAAIPLDRALGALADRLAGRPRTVLGLAGPPGVGKSTAAERVRAWAEAAGIPTVVVPMDGFHLAQTVLDARGLAQVKGAPRTFDALGYAALLARVRAQQPSDGTVWAPAFDRSLEDPVAGSIAVDPSHRLVVAEGNYLLQQQDPWPQARAQLDECWYLDLADDVRRERLARRHVEFGRTREVADARASGPDEANAGLVRECRAHADLVVLDV